MNWLASVLRVEIFGISANVCAQYRAFSQIAEFAAASDEQVESSAELNDLAEALLRDEGRRRIRKRTLIV